MGYMADNLAVNIERAMILQERRYINTEDIYYNKDKFDSGEINLCFVTGHSGSGKSTMARNMSGNKAEHYELDDVLSNKLCYSMANLKEYGDLIYSFFNGPGKKYYYTKQDIDDGNATEYKGNYDKDLITDFIKYSESYSKSHKDTKYIIDGIQLYMYIDPQSLKNYAVYIKGTSRLISDIRAAKRDSHEEYPDNAMKRTKAFLNRAKRFLTKESVISENDIKKYRDYFSKLQNRKGE